MNKKQLNTLYKKESKGLYYLAYTYVKDSDIAKDIVQNAFIKIWENQIKVENPIAFLKKSTINLSLNYIRDKKSRENIEKIYIDNKKLDNINVDNFCLKNKKIAEALNQLSDNIKKTIVLKCINELKYTEIAEELDIPVNTVKSRLKVRYKKIREGLNAVTS